MISNRLKTLFGITLLLVVAHGVEENLTGFLYIDSFNLYFSNLFGSKEEIFYWSFHIMWWLMLVVLYLLMQGGKWALVPLTLFGVVYFFEIHHIIKALLVGSYYPGMISALFYPIIGVFYWKEIIKSWRNYDRN